MNIIKVKVWTAPKTGERRVYATIETEIEATEKVYTDDGFFKENIAVLKTVTKEGTLYITGSHFQKPGSIDQGMTAEEWAQVKAVAYTDDTWHTMTTPTRRTGVFHCPDCGAYDDRCIGGCRS